MQLDPAGITHPDDVALTRYAHRDARHGRARRCSASRSATSTRSATRSGSRSAGACSATTTASPQYLIGMVQDLGERRVAHTLQRSMLTTELPRVDGVELAVRYLPGTRQTEISGDWYDVIPLPDGRVGVVIGDVVGRGIEAAATMSQLRTALRAYAIDGLQPAEVVGKLHRLVDHLRRRPQHDARLPGLRPVHARGALRQRRAICRSCTCPPAGRRSSSPGARSTPLGAAPVGARDPAGARRARPRRRGPAVHRRARRAPRRRHRQPPGAAARGRRRRARRSCRPRSSTSRRRSSATTRCARTTSRCSRCASHRERRASVRGA